MRYMLAIIITVAALTAALGQDNLGSNFGTPAPVKVLEARKAETQSQIVRLARDRKWVAIKDLQDDVREINQSIAWIKANPLGGAEGQQKVADWLTSQGYRPQGWIMTHVNEIAFTRAEGEALEDRVEALEASNPPAVPAATSSTSPSSGATATAITPSGTASATAGTTAPLVVPPATAKGVTMNGNTWFAENWMWLLLAAIVIYLVARSVAPNITAFIRNLGISLTQIPDPAAGDDETLVVDIPGLSYVRRRKRP